MCTRLLNTHTGLLYHDAQYLSSTLVIKKALVVPKSHEEDSKTQALLFRVFLVNSWSNYNFSYKVYLLRQAAQYSEHSLIVLWNGPLRLPSPVSSNCSRSGLQGTNCRSILWSVTSPKHTESLADLVLGIDLRMSGSVIVVVEDCRFGIP